MTLNKKSQEIHEYAKQKGFRDSAEHLRWIISELERGFIEVTNVQQSNFKQL